MDKYLLSVIIPVYNVEDYLRACLDSVYSQITKNVEVIIVDDGSTDSSPAICDEYAEKYPDVTKVIHQENKGLGGARDSGIDIASGEYLLFIDSDDTVTDGALDIITSTLCEKSPDCVVFPINCTDENGKILSVQKDSIKAGVPVDPSVEKAVLCGLPAACNKVFRTSLFKDGEIRFPSRVWYEDIRTTPKLFSGCHSVIYLEKPLYNYLQRSGSIMNNANVDRNSEIIDALDDLTGYFKAHGIYEKYRDELEFLIIDHAFVSASVRVLRVSPSSHPLIRKLREYTYGNCRSIASNPYVKVMPRNRRIVLFLLKKRLYFAIKLIFR